MSLSYRNQWIDLSWLVFPYCLVCWWVFLWKSSPKNLLFFQKATVFVKHLNYENTLFKSWLYLQHGSFSFLCLKKELDFQKNNPIASNFEYFLSKWLLVEKTSNYQNSTHEGVIFVYISWLFLKRNVGCWPSKLDILFCKTFCNLKRNSDCVL